MQVDIGLRFQRAIASTGPASLNAKHRRQRRFAECADRGVAQLREGHRQSDDSDGFAFAQRSGIDRGHTNVFRQGAISIFVGETVYQLGLKAAVRLVVTWSQPDFFRKGIDVPENSPVGAGRSNAMHLLRLSE